MGHVILSFGCGKDSTAYLHADEFKYDVGKIVATDDKDRSCADQLERGVALAVPSRLKFWDRPAAGVWNVAKADLLETTFKFTLCSKDMPDGVIFPTHTKFSQWTQSSVASYFLYKKELAKNFYLKSQFWEIDDAGKRVALIKEPRKVDANDHVSDVGKLDSATGALSFEFSLADKDLFFYGVDAGSYECEFTIFYDWVGHDSNKEDGFGKGLSGRISGACDLLKETIKIKISPGAGVLD